MSKKIYGNPVATPFNLNKFTGGGGAETDPTVPEWAKQPDKPTYTAQEVGARPNTWTPTASEVGARPNTWLPTIGEIGAAPAGYGLGEGNPSYADDINKAILPGWYSVGEQTANVPAFVGSGYILWNYSCVFVQRRNSVIWQHLYTEGVYGVGQYLMGVRVSSDAGATWSELEYLNPPMIPGVEYRTTERYNGKAVWTVSVDLGSHGPGMNSVETPFSAVSMIRHSGTVTNFSAPELYPTSEMNDLYANAIQAFVTNGYLGFRAIRGSSYEYAAPFNAQAWYTKE